MPLLEQAKRTGLVDDRWLRIATTLIGRDTSLNAGGELNGLLSGSAQSKGPSLPPMFWTG